jgi:hypothetical protein
LWLKKNVKAPSKFPDWLCESPGYFSRPSLNCQNLLCRDRHHRSYCHACLSGQSCDPSIQESDAGRVPTRSLESGGIDFWQSVSLHGIEDRPGVRESVSPK